MQTENQLVEIPPKDAYHVFTTEGEIDKIIARVKQEIDKFEPDVTTEPGRKEIASMAYKVARSKTYIDGVGKEIADEVKQIPKKVDKIRKHAKDTLEAWQHEVRKPLTDWEAQEKDRVERHLAAVEDIRALGVLTDSNGEPKDAAALQKNIETAIAIDVDSSCEEFEDEYAMAKRSVLETLRVAHADRVKHEADQAELERLREEAAEREAKEREEQIKRDAEKKARQEAEEKAEAERLEAQRREDELKRQAEDAEKRAREAEETAKREVEEKQRREREDEERRRADEAHKEAVHDAAAGALVSGGMKKEAAAKAIALIAANTVPNVSIHY